ncbi:MAG: type IV pilin N-terminal domain-containing protein [Methanoculleus marisnigri]|nr:type IV pilin N-terminal domain-containing protein [Methanoculleus marisnigri]
MNFKNEEAVSPVIGVILMVAITVILAAVIAAFVFGMTGNVQSTKNIAATAKQVGTDVVITYQGGADQASVEYLIVNWNGASYYSATNKGGSGVSPVNDGTTGVELKPSVGHVMTLKGATPEADKVVVVAHFTDGSDQVVLDTTV